MIAYHGTAVSPETIRREGLQPIQDFRAEADKVLAGYPAHRLPKWVLRHVQWEVNSRIETGNGKIHCTLSKRQAWAYSGTPGGEFRALIQNLICIGLRRKELPYKTSQAYVVTVSIPIDKHTAEIKARIKENGHSWLELRENGGWDIKVDSVPPKHIVRIEEVKGGKESGTED